MSTVLEAPPIEAKPSSMAVAQCDTLADLVAVLGDIPLQRIRMKPMPGTATEQDLLETRYCELIDGVLVERAMGYFESRLGFVLGYLIETWLESNDIGYCNGEGAFTRMDPGNVRLPDVSFVRWERVGDKVPRDPICGVAPNLAVEVLSYTNTKKEIERKREEFFRSNVELVWIVEPVKQIVEVWTTAEDHQDFGIEDMLDGGTVLPGFRLSIREWFARAGERSSPSTTVQTERREGSSHPGPGTETQKS